MPEYEADSSHWDFWFALEHHHTNPVPPPVVKQEEGCLPAGAGGALETSIEEERLKVQAGEVDYQVRLAEAIALFRQLHGATVTTVAHPLMPKPELVDLYIWTGQLREWVSAPSPVWLGVTPAQEVAYLKHWRQRASGGTRRWRVAHVEGAREGGGGLQPRRIVAAATDAGGGSPSSLSSRVRLGWATSRLHRPHRRQRRQQEQRQGG